MLAVLTGIEPVISSVTERRDNHFTTRPWLQGQDSNLQFLGYEPNELPFTLPCGETLAEDEGFEPPRQLPGLLVFKTSPFIHLGNLPQSDGYD